RPAHRISRSIPLQSRVASTKSMKNETPTNKAATPARNGRNGSSSHHLGFNEQLVAALDALENGNFSVRMPLGRPGTEGDICEGVNSIAARLERFNSNLARLRKRVGEEGKIGERLSLGDSVGGWAERIEAINSLVDELSQPTVDMGR